MVKVKQEVNQSSSLKLGLKSGEKFTAIQLLKRVINCHLICKYLILTKKALSIIIILFRLLIYIIDCLLITVNLILFNLFINILYFYIF